MDNFKIVFLFGLILCLVGVSSFLIVAKVSGNEVLYQLRCEQVKIGLLCHIKNLTDKTLICVGKVDGYTKEVLIRPDGRSRYSLSVNKPVIRYCRIR